jgi:hypothetical protein
VRPSSRAVPPGRPVRSGPGRPPHRIPTRPVETEEPEEPEEAEEPQPVPDPPTPGRPRSRRRTLIAVLVGVGVVVLLVEFFAIASSLRSDEPDDPDPPAAALPLLAPDDLPERGALVLSEVRADGSVRVSQWFRSGDGLDELLLTAPRVSGAADPIRATDGRLVAADGTVIADDLTVGTTPRLVRFADSTTMVRATYVLRGAVERSTTADGRLRALVVSLDVDLSSLSGPTVAVVETQTGGEILGLACGNAQSEVELLRPCGTPDGARWRVRLPPVSREDRVTATVDVPAG